MTLTLFVLAAVAAVDGPRLAPVGVGWRLALMGAALAWLGLVPLAAFSEPILDALQISDPTARMAAGVVLLVTGGVMFGAAPPSLEPASRWPALMPLAFPLLLTPGLGLLALSASADRGAWVAVAGLGGALVTFPLVSLVGRGPAAARAMAGLAQVLAVALVLAAFGLLMDGVFDI